MSFGKYVVNAAIIAVGLGLAYEADAQDKKPKVGFVGTPVDRNAKKKTTTPACSKQYDAQGICTDLRVATALGVRDHLEKLCQGDDVCVNGSQIENLYDSILKLQDTVNKLPTAPAEQPSALTELQQFHLQLSGEKCKAEYDTFKGLLDDAEAKKKAREGVEKATVEYLKGLSVPEEVPAGMTPLDALKAKLEAGQLTVNVGDITQRLEGIKNIRKAEEDAVKTAEDYKAGLVKKDCGYVEAPDRVDLIPGIGVVVDTDGNVGAQAEVSLLYRVLPSVGVGGYVNASLLKREAKDSRTHDLGIAVETVDETDTTRRYLGGGATVSLSLASWLELQASLGAAWNRLEESKEINRLGETQTLSSSRHEVVGEASIGPKFSYKRFMCRPAVRTNTKFDGADFTFDCGYNF